MLDDVGASDLNLLWQPQLVVELEDVEYESGDSPGPGCDDEETDHLAPDLVHDGDLVISIKHSAGSDDEGSSQDSHYPTARVDSNSVQRVVNPEPDDGVVDYHVHQGGQNPDHEGCPGGGPVTGGAGRDHPTKNPVDGGEETPLFPEEPEAEEGDDAAAGATDHRIDNRPLDYVSVFVGGDGTVGGAIEREEAKHENESSECSQRHGVARDVSDSPVLIKSPDPRPQEESSNKATDSAQVMDNSTAGEVNVAIDCQPTLICPGPVNHHGVDNGGDDGAEMRHNGRQSADLS